MKYKNVGAKAAARAAIVKNPPPPPAPPVDLQNMDNPEGVELLLKLRRKTLGLDAPEPVKLKPPVREGMSGLLKHPTLAGVVTGWMNITEEVALDWLDHNKDNRKLNKGKMASFARQHHNSDFVTTHQGIAFDNEGNLIDGQHTCKMVLLAHKPVLRMVTFGLPKKPEGKDFTTMDVVDAGARSISDQLKISHGITESGPKKQICIALGSLCYGSRTRALSVGQVLAVLNAFDTSINFVLDNRAKEKGLRQIGVLAGFAFALASAADSGAVEKLFLTLNTGDGLAAESVFKKLQAAGTPQRPVEHLRHFLTSPESVLLSKSMNRCIAEVTLQVIYGELHKAKITELTQAEVGLKWFAAKQKDRVEKIAALFRLPEAA